MYLDSCTLGSSAVERVGTNSKLILSILGIPESQVLGQGVPYHIHLRHSGSPREPAQQKSTKSRKWLDFGTNGTPEALDERNPYSATSRSHWEGSRTLERGPGPQKWGRRHGEAFKFESALCAHFKGPRKGQPPRTFLEVG